jgi:predicted alpha/beta hydrolase
MNPIDLVARDGQRLAATRYAPTGVRRGGVVVIGATGVAQRFYRRFAQALSATGLEVLTFDLRGIGASRAGTLRGFECGFRHWAELDADAAVEFMLARGPTAVVGHSFGGHAFGQLTRPNDTLGLYTVATGAAWSGYMPAGERLKVETMWKVLGPLTTRVAGFLPGKVWGGEDLPLGVYRDWKRWSHLPRYFFDDPSMDAETKFARVRVPIHGVTAEDDLWAPPASMRVFLSQYLAAPVTLEVHQPAALGVGQLGHMGHFRAEALPAFVPHVTRWLDERLLARGS